MFNIKAIIFQIIFIPLIPFNAHCNKIDTTIHKKNIVIIFDHIPPYIRTVYPFPKMRQMDNSFQVMIADKFYQYNFNPQPSKSDTIIFAPQNDYIVLSFLYSMNLAAFDYVIDKGDTITFAFVNNLPYARCNTPEKDKSLNYEYGRMAVNKNNLQPNPYDIYKHPLLVAKDINDAINNTFAVHRDYYNRARSFLNNEQSSLDSSKDLKGKYSGTFNFFLDKYTYEINELDFEQNKLDPDSLHKILANNKYLPIDKSWSYFFPFIEAVAEKVIVKQATVLKYDNGSDIDYRDVYDRVSSWPAINNFYRKFLQYNYLKKIGSMFSTADLQKYLSDFASSTHDSILVKKIKDEFPASDYSSLSSKDSIYVLDANSHKFSFQAFLASCKGKTVYIDFWASWCVPCREEMKSAAKLREAFKDSTIVFAYFSLDKNKNDWLEACDKEKLDIVPNNYLLINVEASEFLKSINLGPIPRHLFYDKAGNLVNKNAPGPGSAEIPRLISQYSKH